MHSQFIAYSKSSISTDSLGEIEMLASKWFISIFVILLLPGCFYASTDFVEVEPGKHVPVPVNPQPNTSYGWVEVEPNEAQGFVVRVGNLTYKRIIEPYKFDGEITFGRAVSAFATFAENEVEKAGFCKKAVVPEKSRRLYGSNTPPEMHIYVECLR